MAARLALFIALFAALLSDVASTQDRSRDLVHRRDNVVTPVPRPRPAAVGPALPSSAAEGARNRLDQAVEARAQCLKRLVPELAVADPEPAIDGPGLCRASDLVRLQAIRLASGNRVELEPAARVP